jgi:ABC-type branched-subunit amino acid transport system ATPase component
VTPTRLFWGLKVGLGAGETTIICTIAGATCGKEGVCARTARDIGGMPGVEEAMGEG